MGKNRDEQEYQPWDEILNQQMVEESWQPAQLPADRQQVPVVPQPMGGGKPPTFQHFITLGPEPTVTVQPALVPGNQPMLPAEELDDRQKVASWLYDKEDEDMESILDPNHPAQAQMEDEGWDQLRNDKTVPNKGVAPYVDHEDRIWKPVTRDQKRILKAKSRAEKRHHKLNYQRNLIPSALRLPKQPAPTLLPPMFNIMGGERI